MESKIKVKKIMINNLKNIKNGEICSDIDFESIGNSDVVGIYGQNGSGKTAAIEAFALLKKILTMQSLPDNSNHLIYYNHKTINLSFVFIITNKFGEFYAYYDVVLEAGENKLFISSEKLSYKENKYRKQQKILVEKEGRDIIIRNNRLEDFDEKIRLKILLANELSLEKNTSFIFNKNHREIYKSNFNDEEYEIFENIFNDFGMNFHIINNEQTGLILANILMPFSFNLNEIKGKIPYALSSPMVLSDKAYNDICKVIGQINIVLVNIVPGLQILVNQLNNETMENGQTGIRFEFLSKKDEIKLPLRCESAGILKLISILSTLIAVFNKSNSCVIIDELDSGVFEYLLGEILEVINENGKGQLFFTSHNLRALEVLPNKKLWFTTSNESKRFIHLKGVKKLSNSRDIYLRAVQLGGQNENLYIETDHYDIKKSFRKAGKLDV